MIADKWITFYFAFRKGSYERYPVGVREMSYRTERGGPVAPLDYVALAFDYVPRVYWAFESQGRLPLLAQIVGAAMDQVEFMPLPASANLELHLSWCENLRAQLGDVPKPQISVTSTVMEASSRLRRALYNPIPFTLGFLLRRVTLNMHFATLNAVLEYAALVLDEPRRPQFNAAISHLFGICQREPGFWNGNIEGPVRSMHVVDGVLRDHGLMLSEAAHL